MCNSVRNIAFFPISFSSKWKWNFLPFTFLTVLAVIVTSYLLLHPTSSGLTSQMQSSLFMADLIRVSNRVAWIFMYLAHFVIYCFRMKKIQKLLQRAKISLLPRPWLPNLCAWQLFLFGVFWICYQSLTWSAVLNFFSMNLNNFLVTATFKNFSGFLSLVRSNFQVENLRSHDRTLKSLELLSKITAPFLIATILYISIVTIGYAYLTFFTIFVKKTVFFTVLYKLYLLLTIGRLLVAVFEFVKSFNETIALVSLTFICLH